MKNLYVIFINFNSRRQLYEGVSFALNSKSVSAVIIVDNGSTDNSLDYLKKLKKNKKILLIRNKKNLGFYKALNIAVKKAIGLGAEAVMPIDFDLLFNFDFIDKLSKVNVDIVAPVLKFERGGRILYDYGGKISSIFGSQKHILLPSPNEKIGHLTTSDKTGKYKIDYVSGGCTIIKKDVFDKIGLFDEDYFVYWGDADYVIRAREAGFKVVMDGTTIVCHKLELARETLNIGKLKISFFDNISFILKRIAWYFWPLSFAYLFLLTILVSGTVLKSILKRLAFTANL